MRKSKPKKRHLLPDPKFNDVLVTRFVNDLMLDGKKSVAYSVFYDSLEMVEKRVKDTELSPLDVWKKALENIIIVDGVSKAYAMTGWRIGWTRFPTAWPPRSVSAAVNSRPVSANWWRWCGHG